MTDWSYLPGEGDEQYFTYPDEFEFGGGDDDDPVFEQAWEAMQGHPDCTAISFPLMEVDAIFDEGALLVRTSVPDVSALRAQGLAKLVEAVASIEAQAMFPDLTTAVFVAMKFDGAVIGPP